MTAALLLASLASFLLAMACLLWWELPARLRRRQTLEHFDRLVTNETAAASPATKAAAAPLAQGRGSRWMDGAKAVLTRAGLPATLKTVMLLLGPCLALCLLAWWRFPDGWLVPPSLGLSLLVVGLLLKRRIDQQRMRITRQLPGFLDDMVRMTSIGNSVPMAFAATFTTTETPLRTILESAMARVRSGADLDWALAQASAPYKLESLEMLHVVTGISIRLGGRSDQILQRISHFLRDHEQAQREFVATTAETRMSAWVIGLLPMASGTILALSNPDFFNPLFTTTTGHHLLLFALLMETAGALLLFRLAKSL